jgi:phosphomevalonate kinase
VTTVEVPGKVMLSGEYAVLRGGAAVVAPVPRTLTVSEVAEGDETTSSPVIREALAISIPPVAAHEAEHGLPRIAVDRSQFVHEGQKLGLGSSSAEAVGVVAVRYERAGLPWREQKKLRMYAYLAHRAAQGGLGSGADVACCALGEWVRYGKGERELPGGKTATTWSTDPVADRPAFPLSLAWTGRSADTRTYVDAFEGWVEAGDDEVREAVEELVGRSHALAAIWMTADLEGMRTVLDRYVVALRAIGEAAGFEYDTPEIRKLRDWAVENGGYAKPVGAGGGDMALMLGDLPLDELPGPVIRLS